MRLSLDAVVDLRQASVRSALGLRGGERRFLDAEVARATATFIRRTTPAKALLVPSVAFLDDARCWNLVLFLEKLPEDLNEFITATAAGTFSVAP